MAKQHFMILTSGQHFINVYGTEIQYQVGFVKHSSAFLSTFLWPLLHCQENIVASCQQSVLNFLFFLNILHVYHLNLRWRHLAEPEMAFL